MIIDDLKSVPRTYGAIVADPPWSYETWSAKGKDRSAENHYSCMTMEQIKALPIGDCAAPDAVLFLWATDTILDRAFEVIRAWGFKYKTVGFVWAKLNARTSGAGPWHEGDFFTGMGHWSRANTEYVLLATRGKPARVAKNVRKLLIAPRREHSRKPDEMYQRVRSLVDGPYLDVFSRQSRPGWDSWGNETSKFG